MPGYLSIFFQTSARWRRSSPGINDLAENSIPDPGLQDIGDNEIRLPPQGVLEVELEIHKVCDGPKGATDGTPDLEKTWAL